MNNFYCVSIGTLTDGYRFFGPFTSFEEALNWSEQLKDEWTIIPLDIPTYQGNDVTPGGSR